MEIKIFIATLLLSGATWLLFKLAEMMAPRNDTAEPRK